MDRPIDTFEQARESTRRNAKTFYLASHALPPEKRKASYALYSFCRYVDDIADASGNRETARAQLELIRTMLNAMYDSRQTVPQWGALQETISRYAIPRQYFFDLVEGVEMDLDGVSCSSFADLQKYCYHVASVVGLMMTRVLQPDDERAIEYAEHLGTAMQLTNILRDIGEDFRMNRIYLPRDEMREGQIHEEDLRAGTVTPAFRTFMQRQIARARGYYAMAEPGIALLPNDGSRYCVKSMGLLYSRILNAIERNDYDVFTRRAHLSLPAKLLLAGSMALNNQARPYIPGTRPHSVSSDAKSIETARHPMIHAESSSHKAKEQHDHE